MIFSFNLRINGHQTFVLSVPYTVFYRCPSRWEMSTSEWCQQGTLQCDSWKREIAICLQCISHGCWNWCSGSLSLVLGIGSISQHDGNITGRVELHLFCSGFFLVSFSLPGHNACYMIWCQLFFDKICFSLAERKQNQGLLLADWKTWIRLEFHIFKQAFYVIVENTCLEHDFWRDSRLVKKNDQ